MKDQRIEAEDEFDTAWDEPTAATDDDQAAESNTQDEFDDELEADDQTPATGISEDVTPDDQEIALAEQRAKSAEGRLRKLEEQHNQYQQELEKLRGGAAPKTEPAAADTQDWKPAKMSDQEWDDFQSDFPDIAQSMKEQGEQINEVRSAVGEVKAQREKEQQDAQAELSRQAQDTHHDQIRQAHDDYDRITEDLSGLTAFVEAQSPLLKRAYQTVMETGSAEEIIELLDDYKTTTTDTPVSTSKRPALAVKTRKSRPSLTTVAQADPDDYDAAWDEAVGKKP